MRARLQGHFQPKGSREEGSCGHTNSSIEEEAETRGWDQKLGGKIGVWTDIGRGLHDE